MAREIIKRELLAILMESPCYFSIPLRKRLEFIKFFSQQSVFHHLCKYNSQMISVKSDQKRPDFVKAIYIPQKINRVLPTSCREGIGNVGMGNHLGIFAASRVGLQLWKVPRPLNRWSNIFGKPRTGKEKAEYSQTNHRRGSHCHKQPGSRNGIT